MNVIVTGTARLSRLFWIGVQNSRSNAIFTIPSLVFRYKGVLNVLY